MSTLISGILKNANGQPMPNVGITLTSLRTNRETIISTETALHTSADGSYSFDIAVGTYSVSMGLNSAYRIVVGQIRVFVDSIPGTLEDFLTIPGVDEVTPEVLAQVLQARYEAVTAAQSAADDATAIINQQLADQENRFDQFILSSGYQFLGDYEDGPFQFSARNQYIRYDGQYYRLNAATDVGFTTSGATAATFANDITHFVLMDGDTLRQNLGSGAEGMGGTLVALKQGGTVQSAIAYVTPGMFSNLVVNGDWSAAIIAADLKARDLGFVLDGQGLVYTIGSAITLRCSRFRNMLLVPTPSYAGAAPIFVSHLITGLVEHDSVEVVGFKLTGAKILQGAYVGTTEAIFKGVCRYNNNGNLIRTTLTSDVNTSTAWIVPVADASIFSAEDPVHIGDGRYKILSISGNNITLYNDGVGATLFDSGTRYQHYVGQYVTKNQGYDNNGIRIGNSTQGWNIKISGLVEAVGNGWTGFYHDSGAYGGYHEIDGIRASSNGYIGIGLGYVNKGYVRNCIAEFNGNNGIDIFEAKQTYHVHSNTSIGNGVDNIFVGGNGEAAAIYDNECLNAHRIGILVFGRTTALYAVELTNNRCLGNKYRSIGVTGGRYVKILGGHVGGANNWSIYIEGRAGLNNPDKVTIKGVDMYQSVLGDVGGNLRNNTAYASGTMDLVDNNTFSRMPVTNVSNVNYYGCKFYPSCYIAGTGEYTAAAGAIIPVSLSIRRPHNSSVTDAAAVQPVTFTISSNSDGSDQSSVTTATKTLTNVTELLNTATTRGKIVAVPDSGNLGYNFSLSTAGTRYILVESGGFRKLLTLNWT